MYEKIIQDFNLHMCINYWGNNCYFPWFFKWHATWYHEWLGEINLFSSGSHFYVFYLHSTIKSSSIISLVNADSWFITEYHFHPIVYTLWLFLFNSVQAHFPLCVSAGFCLTFLNVNPISFSKYLTVLFRPICFSFVLLYFLYFPGILFWIFYSNVFMSFVIYQYIFLL